MANEFWDLYNSQLEKIGTGHRKEDSIPAGTYHLAVEIWIIDGTGRMLLAERAATKKYHPRKWECIGGSAQAGETFIDAAVRELEEELGLYIEVNDLDERGCEIRRTHIVMTYILWKNVEIDRLVLRTEEVVSCAWFSPSAFSDLCGMGAFVPFLIRRYTKYVKPLLYRLLANRKPASVRKLLDTSDTLYMPERGLPDVGRRPDGSEFFPDLKIISDAFKIYGNRLYAIETLLDGQSEVNNSIGGGSPALSMPFPGVREAINRLFETSCLSQYPLSAGDRHMRSLVRDYLLREGFHAGITEDNIIFTASTTQAFWLISKLILRPYDVMLFTAPTYGLFAFIPEREGGISKFVNLRQEDGWIIDPSLLAVRIDELNAWLADTYKSALAYTPRVAGFLNENPHNPTGKVMSWNEADRMREIARICHEKGVFLIDDCLYRDLCYDRSAMPCPAMAFPEYADNVISLLGLSKSYGLAGIRAGMIVADDTVIRAVRNMLFQVMESPSHLQAVVMGTVFNTLPERDRVYNAYFGATIPEYIHRYQLMRALLMGLEAVNMSFREAVRADVHAFLDDPVKEEWILSGMEGVIVVDGMEPESGFFVLVDFSGLRGKRNGSHTITDDESLLCYLYRVAKIKFIIGRSIAWPVKEHIIGRLTYAVERREIVSVMSYMKQALEKLENPKMADTSQALLPLRFSTAPVALKESTSV